MRKAVYIETSVVSYLAARHTRDLIAAARQELTHEWWLGRRDAFDLFISQVVLSEASQGDPDAAARRLELLRAFPLLDVTVEAEQTADALLEVGAMPPLAATDALHLAIAAVHGVHYLLTWNFRHLANAERADQCNALLLLRGYHPPIICTPEQLMGEDDEG